jgi:hypothetical protein
VFGHESGVESIVAIEVVFFLTTLVSPRTDEIGSDGKTGIQKVGTHLFFT